FLGMAGEYDRLDVVGFRDDSLAREQTDDQIRVVARRPHGDEPAPAVQPDLERLLDRDDVRRRRRRAVARTLDGDVGAEGPRGLTNDDRLAHHDEDTNARFAETIAAAASCGDAVIDPARRAIRDRAAPVRSP